MAPASKDLFDDSTMSFGEHLEALRMHLWKALIGVVIAVVICLFKGDTIVRIVREPIDNALKAYSHEDIHDDAAALEDIDFWQRVKNYLSDQFSLEALSSGEEPETLTDETGAQLSEAQTSDTIRVAVSAIELGRAMHQLHPETFPAPSQSEASEPVYLSLTAPEFRQFKNTVERVHQVVALNVQEPFMTYLKVSMITGLILASPWVFYQLWMFVAAGLFPHERKYVYVYGSVSVALFLIGVVFCFYLVFPFVLRFLLGFNRMIGVHPQIRLSEWISFAVTLPLLFGVSFQLPLVMLFLERLGILDENTYREKRRMAILVISIISMVLTPADPVSMLMMMFPLLFLYELGIVLCRLSPPKSPFETGMITSG